MIKFYSACLILFIFSSLIFSQTDNLTVFNTQIDSIVKRINEQLPPAERVSLNPTMPDDYFAFNSRIINRFKSTGREVTTGNRNSGYGVNIMLEKAKVEYSDIFREKLFGDFKVKRIITLTGNYNITRDGLVFTSDDINYQKADTVNYDDIKSLENNSLPYTKGEIPSEPVFSSLLEPVIAISAAALTVILFFTVRSK